MRPITKVFLLLLVALFAYLIWPRTTDLKQFVPGDLANLEVENWTAQKQDKGLGLLMVRYKIYTSQYNFPPLDAFGIAQNEAAASKEIAAARAANGDPAIENRALAALTEKYARIKKQAKGDFDADAMAREQLEWHRLELDKAPAQDVAASLSRILAGLYGGDASEFLQVADGITAARGSILGDEAPTEGSDPKVVALDAYSLLKEIASTPVNAPAAE
jgi:hypothetical protein